MSDQQQQQQFASDIFKRLQSSKVTLLEVQRQQESVKAETEFRWIELIIFSIILLMLIGFYIYQRTTLSSRYKTVIAFINDLRKTGDYRGPGTGYDWAWYFKYPRLAFSMPNINLPAAVIFGYYNSIISPVMESNRSCLQELYMLGQNRPQATAAQLICTWYMATEGTQDTPIVCQNLCPPIDPYEMADFLNTTLNTSLQLTGAAAIASGGNPLVIGAAFVTSTILGMSQAKHQGENQTADCEATQQNCVSQFPGIGCGMYETS